MHSSPDPAEQPETSASSHNKKLGLGMSVIAWITLLVLIGFYFQEWLEEKQHPNRGVQTTATSQGKEIVLNANRSHHYIVDGSINRHPVTYIIDTGASDVVIPADLAARIKLKRGMPVTAKTANGEVTVYRTLVDQLSIAGIKLTHVNASINPGMRGNEVLLGMSALARLEFSQRAQQLILRQPAN